MVGYRAGMGKVLVAHYNFKGVSFALPNFAEFRCLNWITRVALTACSSLPV